MKSKIREFQIEKVTFDNGEIIYYIKYRFILRESEWQYMKSSLVRNKGFNSEMIARQQVNIYISNDNKRKIVVKREIIEE